MSKFLKVKCSDCGGEQVMFARAASKVDCLVCGATIATSTGGTASIKGEIVAKLD
jgi:small subunit ribosomal protein S27e